MRAILISFLVFCSLLVTAQDNKSNNSKFRRNLEPEKQVFLQQSSSGGEETVFIRVSPRQFRHILSKNRESSSDVIILLNQEQYTALCSVLHKKDFSAKILIKVNAHQLEKVSSSNSMYISRPKNQFSRQDPSDLGITLDEQQKAEAQAISLGEQLPFVINTEQTAELRKQMYNDNQIPESDERNYNPAQAGKENNNKDFITENLDYNKQNVAENSTEGNTQIAKKGIPREEVEYMTEEEEEKELQREYIESEIALNELYVADLLHTLATAENQFKEYAKIDLNKNGKGEYAFIQELGGIVDLRSVNGEASNIRVPHFIRPDFAKTAQANKGMASEYGYYIYCYLPGKEKALGEEEGIGLTSDPTLEADEMMIHQQENHFIIYAWPIEQNVTGKSAFVVDNTAKVFAWEKPDYSLENRPKPEDALDKTCANAFNVEGNVSENGKSNQGYWVAFELNN